MVKNGTTFEAHRSVSYEPSDALSAEEIAALRKMMQHLSEALILADHQGLVRLSDILEQAKAVVKLWLTENPPVEVH